MSILIKIITTDTKFKRFAKTNFLYVVDNNTLLCYECKKPIENDTYCYVCSDFDKIYHELCLKDDHIKHTFKTFGHLRQHTDFLCLLRFMPQEHFDAFDTNSIALNI